MYCVKCGVELADSEKKCPLCETPVRLPEGETIPKAPRPYPSVEHPHEVFNPKGLMFILTVLSVIPILVTLVCDVQLDGGVTWSGYAAGGIALLYILFLLPFWFRKPNPVIFLPCDFAAIGLYLLYIDQMTNGGWFLSFAFPVVGSIGLMTAAVVTLSYYLHKGYLYIWGGTCILAGGWMVLLEFLLDLTFGVHTAVFWSLYPLIAFCLIGAMLIVIAICRPLRESLHKKFFL
jgi:hypothetical protein